MVVNKSGKANSGVNTSMRCLRVILAVSARGRPWRLHGWSSTLYTRLVLALNKWLLGDWGTTGSSYVRGREVQQLSFGARLQLRWLAKAGGHLGKFSAALWQPLAAPLLADSRLCTWQRWRRSGRGHIFQVGSLPTSLSPFDGRENKIL
jgi:hypothetical protein